MRTRPVIHVVVALTAVAVITTNASAMYNQMTGRFLVRDPGPGAATAGRITGSPGSITVTGPNGDRQVPALDAFKRPITEGPWAVRDNMQANRRHVTWRSSLTDETIDDLVWPNEQLIYGRSGRVIGSVRNESPPNTWTPPQTQTVTGFDNAYADGPNLYQYCRSQPLVRVDPSGLGSVRCRVVLTNANNGVRRATFTFFVPGFCGSQLEARECCDAVGREMADCYPPGSWYIPTYGLCFTVGQGAFTLCILML